MAIHGRMYTVAAANAAAKTIIAGSGIISPAELNAGDLISVYDTTGRLLGSTNVVSVASVGTPNGILSTLVDSVFQTTFSGYNYLQVRALSDTLPYTLAILNRGVAPPAHVSATWNKHLTFVEDTYG